VKIRPILPSDAESYRSVLARTSEEDRYCRFFHVVNHFDTSDVTRFVDPGPDTIGFIAEDETTALGVAHAFFLSQDSAEIAVVVACDARRRGVGRALLEHLIDEFRARNCYQVTAYALCGNNAFSHLARSVGMTPLGPPSDMMTWTLAVALK